MPAAWSGKPQDKVVGDADRGQPYLSYLFSSSPPMSMAKGKIDRCRQARRHGIHKNGEINGLHIMFSTMIWFESDVDDRLVLSPG
jgi:hypothetical protein